MNLFQQDPTDKQVLFSLFESFSRAKKSYPLLLYSFLLCFNPQLRKKFKVATRQVLSAHPTNELIYKSISRLMAEYHYLDIKGMYDATLDALKKNPSVLSLARFAYKWGIKYYHRQHEGKMTVQDKIYYENKIMGDIARCSGFGKENL